MKFFLFIVLFYVSIAFSDNGNKTGVDTLSVRKNLNGKEFSFDLINKKTEKRTVCFGEDFYRPEWEMQSVTLKINGKDIFLRLNVLYCLWQNITDVNVKYKDGYYVLEISGGDGAFAHFMELWFDDNRIIKTVIFANGEKTDTTTVITHKEVVYD